MRKLLSQRDPRALVVELGILAGCALGGTQERPTQLLCKGMLLAAPGAHEHYNTPLTLSECQECKRGSSKGLEEAFRVDDF